MVFKTKRNSAIKVYSFSPAYERERDIYIRLNERNIHSCRGLAIPRLTQFDDALDIFEMSIVHVPCLIDFGGAYLDRVPDHSSRDDNWQLEMAEMFGANWGEAQAVIREIEYKAGIWIADINPNNIKFEKAG